MARAEIEISEEFIKKAMQHKDVIAHLPVVADRVMRRAKGIASSEGVKMKFWVEESIRPQGRPQAIVYGDNSAQEWGGRRSQRRRILGRAGEEG